MAVRVTEHVQAVVGVPLTVPVAPSIESPAGRPVADHVNVAVDEVSVAAAASALIGVPDGSDCAPGSVTDTKLVIVQPNEAESVAPESSVAVTVTDEVPAVVGVPEMVPVELSIDRPAGRPVAD